jgi:hypothetical protein
MIGCAGNDSYSWVGVAYCFYRLLTSRWVVGSRFLLLAMLLGIARPTGCMVVGTRKSKWIRIPWLWVLASPSGSESRGCGYSQVQVDQNPVVVGTRRIRWVWVLARSTGFMVVGTRSYFCGDLIHWEYSCRRAHSGCAVRSRSDRGSNPRLSAGSLHEWDTGLSLRDSRRCLPW